MKPAEGLSVLSIGIQETGIAFTRKPCFSLGQLMDSTIHKSSKEKQYVVTFGYRHKDSLQVSI